MNTERSLREPDLGLHLLRYLQTGLANRAMYPAGHPEVLKPARALLEVLGRAAHEEPEVTLALIEEELYLNGRPLREASIQYLKFLRMLAELGVEILHVMPGITLEDVTTLIEVLRWSPETVQQAGGLDVVLEQEGVRHILSKRLLRLPNGRYELLQRYEGAGGDDGGGGGGAGQEPGELALPVGEQEAYAGVVGDTHALFDALATSGQLDADLSMSLPQQIVSHCLAEPSAFLSLLHMRTLGDGMFQHAVHTAMLATLLATKLELEEEQLRFVSLGALLHDIGELQLPDALRNAPGPLTPEEWKAVHRHPLEGAKVVLGLADVQPVAATVVLEHHRRFDGGGYPAVDIDDRPHLYARIVSVADAYDAMIHPRPYQMETPELLPVERLLELGGTQFDPTIVRLLLHTVGFYPPGTPVVLSDGRRGVVESPTPEQPFLPRVLVRENGDATLVDTSHLSAEGMPLCTVERVEGLPDFPAPEAERLLDPARTPPDDFPEPLDDGATPPTSPYHA